MEESATETQTTEETTAAPSQTEEATVEQQQQPTEEVTEEEVTAEIEVTTTTTTEPDTSTSTAKEEEGAGGEQLQPPPPPLPTTEAPPLPDQKTIEREQRRSHVVDEILQSERTYLAGLHFIVERYLKPLRGSEVLKPEQLETIFCNIEEIAAVSEELLARLETRVTYQWLEADGIGDIFSRIMPLLMSKYKRYVENHERAIAAATEAVKKKAYDQFQRTVKELPESGGKDLLTYLITPVQRMLRYSLLMKDYIKCTPEGHEDAAWAKGVLSELEMYVSKINDGIKRDQNHRKLCDIERSFTNLPKYVREMILADHMFVREGPLTKVCRKTNMRRYFWLFSDCLMYGEMRSQNSFIYHRHFPTAKLRLKPLADTEEIKSGFQIISTEKSFTVMADTREEKEWWVMDIIEVISGVRTVHNEDTVYTHEKAVDVAEAPVWIPDKMAPRCMICNDHFTVVRRRHHCRNCGKVVCGPCSAKKTIIPSLEMQKPERVCSFCYDFFKIQAGQIPDVQKESEKKDRKKAAMSVWKPDALGSGSPTSRRTAQQESTPPPSKRASKPAEPTPRESQKIARFSAGVRCVHPPEEHSLELEVAVMDIAPEIEIIETPPVRSILHANEPGSKPEPELMPNPTLAAETNPQPATLSAPVVVVAKNTPADSVDSAMSVPPKRQPPKLSESPQPDSPASGSPASGSPVELPQMPEMTQKPTRQAPHPATSCSSPTAPQRARTTSTKRGARRSKVITVTDGAGAIAVAELGKRIDSLTKDLEEEKMKLATKNAEITKLMEKARRAKDKKLKLREEVAELRRALEIERAATAELTMKLDGERSTTVSLKKQLASPTSQPRSVPLYSTSAAAMTRPQPRGPSAGTGAAAQSPPLAATVPVQRSPPPRYKAVGTPSKVTPATPPQSLKPTGLNPQRPAPSPPTIAQSASQPFVKKKRVPSGRMLPVPPQKQDSAEKR